MRFIQPIEMVLRSRTKGIPESTILFEPNPFHQSELAGLANKYSESKRQGGGQSVVQTFYFVLGPFFYSPKVNIIIVQVWVWTVFEIWLSWNIDLDPII